MDGNAQPTFDVDRLMATLLRVLPRAGVPRRILFCVARARFDEDLMMLPRRVDVAFRCERFERGGTPSIVSGDRPRDT